VAVLGAMLGGVTAAAPAQAQTAPPPSAIGPATAGCAVLAAVSPCPGTDVPVAPAIIPLEGADLTRADLTGANLGGASMRDASCAETNFEDSDPRDVDLTGAKLEGARMRGARMRDEQRAESAGAFLDDSAEPGAASPS
jgi:hypothetical protein